MNIVIISGTNREGAVSLRVARRLRQRYGAMDGVDATLLDLSQLPPSLFTPQAYETKPEEFQPFADAVVNSDGLVVVTPEYNGGMPGVLKLFIDMLPFPQSFESRPVCFVGLSAGRWGALKPVEQLQTVFGYRNAHIFPQRVFLPGVKKVLDDNADITVEFLAERLTAQIQGFVPYCKAMKSLA